MVRTIAHYGLMAWYAVGPVVALGVAVVMARRRGKNKPLLGWLMTVCTAVLLATGLTGIYAVAANGQVIVSQVLLGAYFAAGMLFLLKGFDYVLRWLTGAVGKGHRPWGQGTSEAGLGFGEQMRFIVRVVVLFVLGLPYVMATVMTYRAKVRPIDLPTLAYEPVMFTATDGMRLSGWWLPARSAPDGAPEDWGRRTLLVCHGLAANKSNHLVMGQWGPTHGFNVLIFDFRAHGESGGQLTTLGDRERYDVLGAVRWLKTQRAEESQRIVGIGTSMGAAALIAAAADPSEEGQSIDALVVLGTYARLGGLAAMVADRHFVRPLNAMVKYLAVPMAGVQVNADLADFAPGDYAAALWPRPIMIIHGLRDEIIPFEQGESLYEAAAPPREFRPISQAGHNDILDDPNVLAEVQRFAETAQRVPML